jgi:hypothetical protein
MAARAPRRTFATPLVLTLAGTACVTSNPPPQRTGHAQTETHGHGDGHVNPPPPRAEPPWQEAANAQTTPPPTTTVANPPRPAADTNANTKPGVNDHVKGTANPTPPPVAQSRPDPTPKPRGYREWTVSKANGTCSSMNKVYCPEGASCNPPPPAKYDCPKFMADNDRIAVIQRTEKAECYVDHGDFTCPPAASCNPPRPQKVTCPK